MSILDEIVNNKKQELLKLESFEFLDEKVSELSRLESLPFTKGFLKQIQDCEGPALIAEIKKASPSKGMLKENFDINAIAQAYYEGGAACYSVLTDSKYLQGSYENLLTVASDFPLPCLCKEFIIDAKQIAQARLFGADAILLIAAILKDRELDNFRNLAHEYGMDILLEVHNEEEMKRALELDFELIGINNRDLNTFDVSLDTTSKLLSKFKYDLPGRVIVSESGINSKQDILILFNMGAKAFLVGESLIKEDDIKEAVSNLIG